MAKLTISIILAHKEILVKLDLLVIAIKALALSVATPLLPLVILFINFNVTFKGLFITLFPILNNRSI